MTNITATLIQRTNRNIVVRVGEYTVNMIARSPYNTALRRASKTRVYGALEILAPAEVAEVNRNAQTPDFMIENEAEREAHIAEYRRLVRAATRVARPKMIEMIAAAMLAAGSYLTTAATATYSRGAGCACGCSPGFVLSERIIMAGQPVDVWIDAVKTEEKK
jgi:hypothetical protein